MLPDQVEIALHMPTLEEYASKAGVIIELGCGHGNGSTRALIRGLKRSPTTTKLMVSVDIDPNKPDEIPDVDYWHKITGDTLKPETLLDMLSLPDFSNGYRPDLIFIDTNHTYDHMKAELNLWAPPLLARTTWLYHDCWMWGKYNPMTDAIIEFAVKYGLTYTDLSRDSHGLGMMRML